MKQEYRAVASDESEVKDTGEVRDVAELYSRPSPRRKYLRIGALVALVLLASSICIALIATVLRYRQPITSQIPAEEDSDHPVLPHGAQSTKCAPRREWRTLSLAEQQEYIAAILCLRTKGSALTPASNKTSYDDFPWVHSHVGYITHHSASFLPWHRYFMHIYENTLRDKCGYNGGLVYWDWTLDSDKLEESPVFNSKNGFGGDGEVGGEITVSPTGRCVVDGPFSDVIAEYYDVKYQPHCLSRGFRDLEGNLGHIDGRDITPESIEEALSLDDYESFVTLMESRVHDVIPYGISGDFETFTAPYDPLFFLHHTQLDRLWWLWQQRQPDNGLVSYGGYKERHSMDKASLDDMIEMKDFVENVKVADVMSVEGDLLCYTY